MIMVFFRKRKKTEENIQEIKDVVEGKKLTEEIEGKPGEEKIEEPTEEVPIEVEKPVEEEKPIPKTELRKPAFAPLFVKIDRYKSVLDAINEIKTTIMMLKNALSIQKQIEDLRNENRTLLESAVNKVDKKVLTLDSEFLRPSGYEEEFLPPAYETEGLETVVDDLKEQIESLKSELKTIS